MSSERVIFLVDMNAFFISCETAENPELRGKPAAVAGDPKKRSGIILAANYEARKYGIKTTMLLHEAMKLCPELIIVAPHHGLYEEKSKEVMKLLGRYTPVVQQNSIDEAWLDLTGCEALFGSPIQIAENIMKAIIDELSLWCSIGISENKFLSKMASDMKKPLGITQVWQRDVKDKIWPLPVRDMYGIGRQTEKKLNELAMYTIGDIAKCDRNMLVKIFGKYGDELHRLANGVDISPVTENPLHANKSISRSTALSCDITQIEQARTTLLMLSEGVGTEARKLGIKGRTVSIAIKYKDFKSITRQKTIPATYLTKEVYLAGIKLLEENWNSQKPIRLLGIGLTNFDEEEIEQLSIFDMVKEEKSNEKEEKLEKAMDAIREKYGNQKIKRAVMLKTKE